jgi:hypothetical protein
MSDRVIIGPTGPPGCPGTTGATGPTGAIGPIGILPDHIPPYIIENAKRYIRENKILNLAYINVLKHINREGNATEHYGSYLDGLTDMYILLTNDKYVHRSVFENLPAEIENPNNYNSEGSYYNVGPTGPKGEGRE